ncbi:MAG: tRNA pseudouridine(55) synthase TruB [Candidatus Methylumidiphilus alinenensis]|uniref:tRNA pseudouridine synthase B n=1 Tax=Candidatus Methylumidiphilus alinenensis TaxID=2202197 RepID=A0A2W4RI75_9GAMM|nr:MAG: tRNA pseudouridine(55) synthase TruB [Candidatus Methylumidiphilus alinenensis]
MSRRKTGRDIDGMLLLDKSPGMSSNGAVQRVKRLFQANKIGHTGSLDPIATGLLPLCLGEATKLSGFLLNTDKRYYVRVRLGRTTTTADIEGATVDEKPVPVFDESVLDAVLQRFRGETDQIPPMYSALKQGGQRLYDLARKGVEVPREPRRVSIYELCLLEFGADYLDLEVHCSKGTYIRSLAVDIGESLGCGGHVEQLRRLSVGKFDLGQAVPLSRLEALSDEERMSLLLPLSAIADELPLFNLPDELAFFLRRGQAVFVPKLAVGGLLRLFTSEGAFLGIGEVTDDGMIAPRRLVRESATSGQRCA